MEAYFNDNLYSEEDILFEESVDKIRDGVKRSLSFEQAAALIEVKDEDLKSEILDESLKVLIAEMHFIGGKPLRKISGVLKVPLNILEAAKKEMIMDVEAAAIDAFKSDMGGKGMSGNA